LSREERVSIHSTDDGSFEIIMILKEDFSEENIALLAVRYLKIYQRIEKIVVNSIKVPNQENSLNNNVFNQNKDLKNKKIFLNRD